MTWKPKGAGPVWRPGPVTPAQRAEIRAMIEAAAIARQTAERPLPTEVTADRSSQ